MDEMTFVTEAFTQDTGGGIECDVIVLIDGTVLVIGEESIVLYRSLEAWEEINAEGQIGTIIRQANFIAE